MQNIANGQNWTSYGVPPLPPPQSNLSVPAANSAGASVDSLSLGGGIPSAVSSNAAAVWLARMKDPHTLGRAGYELASRPTPEVLAVLREAMMDYSPGNAKLHQMLVTILSKRVTEPGVLDAVRDFMDSPLSDRRGEGYLANVQAALILLHHGQPDDLKRILPLLVDQDKRWSPATRILLRHLGVKPQLAHHPVTTDVLIAILFDSRHRNAADAARLLAQNPNPKARDALGESPWLSGKALDSALQREIVTHLSRLKGPFSARTRENLSRIAQQGEPDVAKLAKDLLRR